MINRMSRVQIWLLLLAFSFSSSVAPITNSSEQNSDEQQKTIYLVSHGWHAGIVLPQADIPDNLLPITEDFPNAQFLEVGWGDMDFYQTPDADTGLMIKAALLPTESVLHIVGFNGPVPTYFPYSEIIQIEIPSAGFEQLIRSIANSFALDGSGKVKPLGPGLYGNSQFYPSGKSYHLFNTCNVWTARVLRSAGLPITPASAIQVENLMSQVRKFGMAVQLGTPSSMIER